MVALKSHEVVLNGKSTIYICIYIEIYIVLQVDKKPISDQPLPLPSMNPGRPFWCFGRTPWRAGWPWAVVDKSKHKPDNRGWNPGGTGISWDSSSMFWCFLNGSEWRKWMNMDIWLVALTFWNMNFMTFHSVGNSKSQLTFIFFRGVEATN